jgi:hypothetical protein
LPEKRAAYRLDKEAAFGYQPRSIPHAGLPMSGRKSRGWPFAIDFRRHGARLLCT